MAKYTQYGPPAASVVTYEFPARDHLPPVKWTWYDGGMQPSPPESLEPSRRLPDNGTLIIGSRATVLADMIYQSIRIVPEVKMRELAPSLPAKTLPRVAGGDHFSEWVRACKGGEPAGSNFDYAARLTEAVLIGNLAVRTRRRIEWDAAAKRVSNLNDANQYLAKEYRSGFLA